MHNIFSLAWLSPLLVLGGASSLSSSTGTPSSPGRAGTAAEMTGSATALDFREMMRKERELALKKAGKKDAISDASTTRYLSNRRRRLDLERNHRVRTEGGVDGIYYVPDFVTAEEGKRLQQAAGSGESRNAEWKDLYKRRLQIHGGTPHPSGMVEEELPLFLREVCAALVEAGVFPESSPPNHVLLNEYSEGQGIGPHKDGPLYEGRVAILSLGNEAYLDFWGSLEDAKGDCAAVQETRRREAARRSVASVKCEHCSLVVFEGRAYRDVWHGIASTATSAESPPANSPAGIGGSAIAAAACSGSFAAETTPGEEHPASDSTSGDGISGKGEDGVRPNDKESSGGSHRCNGPSSSSVAINSSINSAGDKRLSFTIRRVARVISPDSVMEHAEARSEMERRRRGFERSVTETGIVAPAAAGSRRPT